MGDIKSESVKKKSCPLDKKKRLLLITFFLMAVVIVLTLLLVLKNKQDKGVELKNNTILEEEENNQNENEEEATDIEPVIEPSTVEETETKSTEKPKIPESAKPPVPETPKPPAPLTERQKVETLWTDQSVGPFLMYTRDVMTLNKVNYLVGRILRGTVKVGDTMSRKSVCAKSSLPDVSTTVVKILKDRQPVNQATKGETVAVGVADKGLIYSYYGLAGTSFETSGRVTAKIYFLTKEEGNTYVDNILNDTYITANFPVLHEDAQSVGKIRFDGTFQQGTSKDVTILSFATLPTGWAPYRKGLAFNLVKDSLKNIYAIGVITGTTPPCD